MANTTERVKKIIQLFRGGFFSLAFSIGGFFFFIILVRLADAFQQNSGTFWFDSTLSPSLFSWVMRIIVFALPALICGIIALFKRNEPAKAYFWLGGLLLQFFLFILIQPGFGQMG